ncbi:hypothetical protein V8C37DRAFT_386282 [Trichoderma ceciliae]
MIAVRFLYPELALFSFLSLSSSYLFSLSLLGWSVWRQLCKLVWRSLKGLRDECGHGSFAGRFLPVDFLERTMLE